MTLTDVTLPPRCEVCARLHRDRLADYTIASLAHPDGWHLCTTHAYLIAKQRGWSHAAIDPDATLIPIKERNAPHERL